MYQEWNPPLLVRASSSHVTSPTSTPPPPPPPGPSSSFVAETVLEDMTSPAAAEERQFGNVTSLPYGSQLPESGGADQHDMQTVEEVVLRDESVGAGDGPARSPPQTETLAEDASGLADGGETQAPLSADGAPATAAPSDARVGANGAQTVIACADTDKQQPAPVTASSHRVASPEVTQSLERTELPRTTSTDSQNADSLPSAQADDPVRTLRGDVQDRTEHGNLHPVSQCARTDDQELDPSPGLDDTDEEEEFDPPNPLLKKLIAADDQKQLDDRSPGLDDTDEEEEFDPPNPLLKKLIAADDQKQLDDRSPGLDDTDEEEEFDPPNPLLKKLIAADDQKQLDDRSPGLDDTDEEEEFDPPNPLLNMLDVHETGASRSPWQRRDH
ncbi:hypothetical protein CALVIDRAFT_410297 [Calocera viscosa TUFC12733]|uniref:Uncharacterized protein n=1 Tax=Calocera viscosa (strain TUFC12733) TaxID=1330018 RepID=A0A167G6S3_CALVF|nr:hypothetical protein CALVIDRAFT_410297 [Calocera viscosa TUFC12733]